MKDKNHPANIDLPHFLETKPAQIVKSKPLKAPKAMKAPKVPKANKPAPFKMPKITKLKGM